MSLIDFFFFFTSLTWWKMAISSPAAVGSCSLLSLAIPSALISSRLCCSPFYLTDLLSPCLLIPATITEAQRGYIFQTERCSILHLLNVLGEMETERALICSRKIISRPLTGTGSPHLGQDQQNAKGVCNAKSVHFEF